MKPRISYQDQTQRRYVDIEIEDLNLPVRDPESGEVIGRIENPDEPLEKCLRCGCRQFYKVKDFNQVLGCAVVGVGIVLVPLTYGLSLPVVALIDWMLYRKVPEQAVCYKCGAEYRNFPTQRDLKPFMHHIGLKYDKDR